MTSVEYFLRGHHKGNGLQKPKIAPSQQNLRAFELAMAVQTFAEPTEFASLDERLSYLMLQKGDFKLSHALALTGDVEILQKIRSLLKRGSLAQAEQYISEMLSGKVDLPPSEVAEFILEKARHECFEGRWLEAVLSATSGIAKQPDGITLATLLQVRSLAFFELGEFEFCRKDITSLDSLGVLFPKSQARLFTDILKIKLESLSGLSTKTLPGRKRLWSDWRSEKTVQPLTLLALIRLETFLLQVEKKSSYVRWSLASFFLARTLGDELYASLALCELWEFSRSSATLSEKLQVGKQNFARIANFFQEARSAMAQRLGLSTSTKTILQTEINRHQDFEGIAKSVEAQLQNSSNEQFLYFEEHKTLVSANLQGKFDLSLHPRLSRVLSLLCQSSQTSESLFCQAWEMKAFNFRIHNEALAQTLSRLRRNYGLTIKSRDRFVTLENVIYVPSEN